MKIKLKGSKTIEILESLEVDDFKEYLLAFIVSPDGTFQPAKVSEDTEEPIIYMKIVRPELLQEVGTKKKIEIRKGRTQSQFQRSLIEEIAELKGIDKEKYYKERMSANIEKLVKERDILSYPQDSNG